MKHNSNRHKLYLALDQKKKEKAGGTSFLCERSKAETNTDKKTLETYTAVARKMGQI